MRFPGAAWMHGLPPTPPVEPRRYRFGGMSATAIERVAPRLHIAGSASRASDVALLNLAHAVIRDVVRKHAALGGSFVLGIGAEPSHDSGGPAIIFDWTALEAAYFALECGEASEQTVRGPLIIVAASQRGLQQIPASRRELFDALIDANALDLKVLPEGWRSGALIRMEQANAGDVLLTLGGGAGVEHLVNMYSQSGRSIIPLDFRIGASREDDVVGGAGLAARALAAPGNFLRLPSEVPAAARLAALSTFGAAPGADVLASRVVELLNELEPPRCFYVRLLDSSLGVFEEVERFFRDVVDPVVASMGFASFEMGRDEPEYAWMNEEIFTRLYFSSLVLVDLTELRPNCLTELGYALGRAQRVIATARSGTKPPFDLDKIPWFFWDSTADSDELRGELAAHLRLYASRPPLVVVPPLV
jgi:ATP nucleosidase Cap17-like, N-terminal